MRITELLELTSLLAVHGPMFVELVPRIPADMLEQYWVATRCRTDRWVTQLCEGERRFTQVPARDRPVIWDLLEPTAVEVLATDPLTRVWGAVLLAWDDWRRSTDAAPVAHSCFVSHLESRNRVLQLMVKWRGAATNLPDRWNQLRRTTERTTDLLLATLPPRGYIDEFAFDRCRVRRFRREWHGRYLDATARQAIPLATQSLLRLIETQYPGIDGHVDLNTRLASAVLGCLHDSLFLHTGQLRDVWQLRMFSTVTDVQQLMHDFDDPQPHVRWRP